MMHSLSSSTVIISLLLVLVIAGEAVAVNQATTTIDQAKLLCVDSYPFCSTFSEYNCQNNATVRWQLCKSRCQACDELSEVIHKDTGISLPIVNEPVDLTCDDNNNACEEFVQDGLCETQPQLMLNICQASCKFCTPHEEGAGFKFRCHDAVNICPYWSSTGLCTSDLDWPRHVCPQSCDACPPGPVIKPTSTLTEIPDPSECADYNPHCESLASGNACQAHSNFMNTYCRSTCGICSQPRTTRTVHLLANPEHPSTPAPAQPSYSLKSCIDHHNSCKQWAAAGGCQLSATVRKHTCPKACGTCNPYALALLPLRMGCEDHHKSCDSWFASGECERNPGFMLLQCSKSCGLCLVKWTMQPAEAVELPGGHRMPTIGFGTAGLGEDTEEAVVQALQAGYRLIDSAQAREWYREDLVGRAIQRSGLARRELFLTSKLHPRHLGYAATWEQFQQSLTDLTTDHLDLFLLHYPECWGDLCTPKEDATWQSSWKALEELHRQKKVRAIGVSNFNLDQMQQLVAVAEVKPAVLQAHSDICHPNIELQAFCHNHGIHFQAYSSLGTQLLQAGGGAGGRDRPVFAAPPVVEAAAKLKVTPAQVVLRWALQHGQLVIPRSSQQWHMKENLQVLDGFTLSKETMLAIDAVASSDACPDEQASS